MSIVETNDVFVPCRPTNNDVNVTLTLMSGGHWSGTVRIIL